jgi:phosphoribosylglycinamide formyltransferase-1
MDSGPIIAQGAVAVAEDDTAKMLATRVLGIEHAIYPTALRLVAEGRTSIVDGRARIAGAPAREVQLRVPEAD